jgi:hypothetical protein
MTIYKDIEKRKLYQKNWLRQKVIKNKGNLAKGEAEFHLYCYKLIALRKKYDLSDFAYWIIYSRRVNTELLAKVKKVQEIVDIVESNKIVDIVESNKIVHIVESNQIVEIVESNQIVDIVESNQIDDIVESNQIVDIVESNQIVDIVESNEKSGIKQTHFNCDDCNHKLKRTEHNNHHTKCRNCYYPNTVRGKCFITLDV